MADGLSFYAELLGAVALALNVWAYRQDEVNGYRLISAFSLILISTHFLLLDALAAAIGCFLAFVRNLVALRFANRKTALLFVIFNFLAFAYEWFYLQHSAVILIAYASSLIFTVGSVLITDVNRIRRWFILAESLGLVYALIVGSIFGSLLNLFNLASILTKLHRERQLGKLR